MSQSWLWAVSGLSNNDHLTSPQKRIIMFKKIAFLVLVFQISACSELQNIAGSLGETALTSEQIGLGLKEALNIGISNGADKLSATDGYFKSVYKILLPEEVQKVTQRLAIIPGFEKAENELIKLLNRGAEDAAKQAKPIFVSAIKGMTFTDATNILMGTDNAATTYLHTNTNNQLYAAFRPEIVKSLDRVNATKYWKDIVTKYNKIPLVKKVNPELDDYVTQKALDGLFSMVEKKEKGIRNNISERSTDLLKKVFAKQDNK
ncbi:MAG: DUF4197 domain-containing protein [Bacteroidota bacterium]